ncbi:DNA polymerase III subunit gamma and tau [Paenarthrobacter sp. NPDC090520]|uniref:DNA polymerase III subunit gamma and tau n=1 Tax=Paenarthrobacter sp. NPDC090520 TaxID=3364382 RepID=UPI00381CC286
MTVTTALYRRYRPDSFADVIGQEHVTEPLMTALRKNRVNHAYLFSGPRGCGKTTSARILARCLNCAEGPTDTPCGTCPSCVELARGGSGSLDVIEIDAASHGGVDDARDLRERATFAPVRDRYKIFIIDEAHMVTSAGFNALLKIVEEPPEHIKFIFATTEPDKVIGTIRSRTHHYPFRLVPPEPLMKYLELLCHQENVPVAPGVLSLVIRAGGGSVRDSLSVLDQLMAGAGPNGLDYELAVALLGYTHASLLDDVVDAVAAADAATVFRAVDRVIQTGHDPRRFVEDLLERFRDLIIVQAMPESAQAILRGMPEDQIARMRNQATNLGAAELSRAADVTNTALTEMTGATSPRLHLELLCARILLPSSEQTERGIAARIDRVERRLNYAGDAGTPAPAATAPSVGAASAASASNAGSGVLPAAPEPQQAAPAPSARPASQAQASQAQAAQQPGPSAQAPSAPAEQPAPAQQSAAPSAPAQPASAESRSPLTAPRVSTNDWPVEDRTASTARPTQETAGAAVQGGYPQGSNAPGAGPTPPADQSRTATPPTAQTRPPANAPTRSPERSNPEPSSLAPANTAPSNTAPSNPAPSNPVPSNTAPSTTPPSNPAPSNAPTGAGDVEALRRAWPEVLQTLTKIKRSTWALVEPNAQVAQFDGQVLTLAFTTGGLAGAFGRADHSENLRQAIHKTIGIDCQIVAVAGGNSSASSEPNPKAPTSRETPAPPAPGPASAPAQAPAPTPPTAPSTPSAVSAVDTAWGLAPAGAGTPTGSKPPARGGSNPPAPGGIHAPNPYPAAEPNHTGTTNPGPAATAEPSPAVPSPANPSPANPSPANPSSANPSPAAPGHIGFADAGRQAAPDTRTTATPASSTQPSSVSGPPSSVSGPPSSDHGTAHTGNAAEEAAPASSGGPNTPGSHETTQAPTAQPSIPESAGDYSYPDDDWGPPLDEDAPPLDEEPPMDWEPSPRYGSATTNQSAATNTRQANAGQSHTGQSHSGQANPAPAPNRPSTPDAGTTNHGGADTSKATGPNSTTTPPDTSQDPWSRAVEHAPGTWVVGTESNVGAKSTQPAEEAAPASVPDYEPAAAQVPDTAEYGRPTSGEQTGPSGWDVAPASDWPGTAGAQAPAPAAWPSTAASAVPQEARGSVATLEEGAPSGRPVKQSLYQRLTNSPEAQMGRVQAPARTQVQQEPTAEDIPSPEDETIEESRVFGRAAVERILGGKLIEERALDGSPLHQR